MLASCSPALKAIVYTFKTLEPVKATELHSSLVYVSLLIVTGSNLCLLRRHKSQMFFQRVRRLVHAASTEATSTDVGHASKSRLSTSHRFATDDTPMPCSSILFCISYNMCHRQCVDVNVNSVISSAYVLIVFVFVMFSFFTVRLQRAIVRAFYMPSVNSLTMLLYFQRNKWKWIYTANERDQPVTQDSKDSVTRRSERQMS